MTQKNQTRQLSPRQMQILQILSEFRNRQCYSATIQQIAAQIRTSRSTAFEHIVALKEKGFLCASPGRARSLRLTPRGQKLLEKTKISNPLPESANQPDVQIPLLGRVAAGIPIEAFENRDSLSLHTQFGNTEDIFALQVTGDSMIDENILDGDYVICRTASTAENGQLVIASLDDNEVTLKRFYKEPNHVRLQPANDSYHPIYSKNCKVSALVIGIVRKL
ncbi:MAG: transcriptional repressor LexA [Planctomycetota bacterium]